MVIILSIYFNIQNVYRLIQLWLSNEYDFLIDYFRLHIYYNRYSYYNKNNEIIISNISY